jgi:hypothetical protein
MGDRAPGEAADAPSTPRAAQDLSARMLPRETGELSAKLTEGALLPPQLFGAASGAPLGASVAG